MCVDHAWTTSPRPTGLDRNEVGAMLVAAGLAGARDHALMSQLALNGLRVSEAIGADIEALGLERGHRTLTTLRKGGEVVTIPWHPGRPVPLTSWSANAAKDRPSLEPTGGGSIGTQPDGSCAPSPERLGSPNASGPTPCATHSSPRHSTPELHCAMCKTPPVTPTPARPSATTERGSRSTATPPTSSPRSSPAPAADAIGPLWHAHALQSGAGLRR